MNKRMIISAEQAMFSRQKRWLSKESILKAIDHERDLQRGYCAQAEAYQAEAESSLKLAHDDRLTPGDQAMWHTRYKSAKTEAERLFAKADRKEKRVEELGHKLAAFRTELLPFTKDRAVV